MTQVLHSIRRSTPFMPSLLFAIALVSPELGLATDLPIYGGLGGNTDREDCPKGWYLVGLAGKTGSWVDRIAPICAPWLRGSQAFGAPSARRSFGWSTGGNERHESCMNSGRNRHVIESWTIAFLKSDNHYVQYIWANCMGLAPVGVKGSGEAYFDFGSPPSMPPGDEKISNERVTPGPVKTEWTKDQACPAGEVATGIRVRSGKFIDAIGLICGPVPARVGAPAPKVNPRIMMPRDDLFEIVQPYADTTIPHGRLIIVAVPPKVGDTGVADIELRYLNAPADRRHSYPFTTVFSVTKAQLLDGYPVTERATGGYVGRWQIRVRTGMKTPPGDWSAPVRFTMVKAPVPPPMVEMPKLNAPITQTPAPGPSMMQAPPPSSSAPAQMNRSPFMVMPRGVEAESAAPKQ